jgi:hypothetical protein
MASGTSTERNPVYAIKCDDCKTEIGRTDSVGRSAQGGRCESCRRMLDLRATLAMRAEDLRIARKHREEAAARTMSPANKAAYERACRWESCCAEREQAARGAVIRANLTGVTA